jgi:hypothetical protein
MPRADAGVFPDAERSHSGLVHRSRKPEWVNAHRGFESHPLRQIFSATKRCKLVLFRGIRRGAGVVELAALEML